MTLLSVIVPVREMAGRLQNLKRWLSEVGNNPLEVIIIHDIHDEATEAELKRLGQEFPSVKLTIVSEKLDSPGLARNLGIEIASGKYISFWDSDDRPRVGPVISDLEALEENIDVLIGQFETVESDHPEICRFKSNDFQLMDAALNPGLWRMAFRAEKLAGIRFSKYKMGEDQEFLAKVITTVDSLEFSPHIWYTYFTNNSGQLTLNRSSIKDLKELIPRATLHQRHASPVILPVLIVMQIRKILTLFKSNPIIGLVSFLKYSAESFRIGGFKIIPTFMRALGHTYTHLTVGKL